MIQEGIPLEEVFVKDCPPFHPPREYDGAVSGGIFCLFEVGTPLEEERVGGAAQVEIHGKAPSVRGQYPRQLEDD